MVCEFGLGWVGWVYRVRIYSRGDEYVHVEVEACVNSVAFWILVLEMFLLLLSFLSFVQVIWMG